MNDDDELPIDLHTWRVPPPPDQRSAILLRALSPVPVARSRRRVGWMIAAMVLANAAIATIIAIVISQAPRETVTEVRPAGSAAEARVQELLRQLEEERAELQRRIAELDELRAVADELAEKLRQYEQRTKQKRPDKKRAAPVVVGCDEVSCVLEGYQAACCAKWMRPTPALAPTPMTSGLPESLTRADISRAMAAVREKVAACGEQSSAKGKVKLRIEVAPRGDAHVPSGIRRVAVVETPDPVLAHCVVEAVRAARFPQTQNGGSFTYPFVF